MNQIRTFMLMAAMAALFMGLGYMIGGGTGALVAFVLAAGMNVFAWWNSDKMVLRMHHAQEVGPEHPLHALVRPLAARAGLPMPRVYIVEEDQPNAFATGRNPENAAVAATTGLMRIMNQDELEAVMAHELAHVKNRDTLVMTVTATLAGAISMLGNFALFMGDRENRNPLLGIVAMIVAPLAAALVQMAISRGREYGADAMGADICGNPQALASALAKLKQGSVIPNHIAEANPAAASLYIMGQGAGGVRDGLFSTHPAAENRIAALMAMVPKAPARPSALGVGTRARKSPWQ
jgi:heat shock protein HtpX